MRQVFVPVFSARTFCIYTGVSYVHERVGRAAFCDPDFGALHACDIPISAEHKVVIDVFGVSREKKLASIVFDKRR